MRQAQADRQRAVVAGAPWQIRGLGRATAVAKMRRLQQVQHVAEHCYLYVYYCDFRFSFFLPNACNGLKHVSGVANYHPKRMPIPS